MSLVNNSTSRSSFRFDCDIFDETKKTIWHKPTSDILIHTSTSLFIGSFSSIHCFCCCNLCKSLAIEFTVNRNRIKRNQISFVDFNQLTKVFFVSFCSCLSIRSIRCYVQINSIFERIQRKKYGNSIGECCRFYLVMADFSCIV